MRRENAELCLDVATEELCFLSRLRGRVGEGGV
jgi:hypothetical protein